MKQSLPGTSAARRRPLPSPEGCFARLLGRVPPYIRWTFLAAAVLGLLTHLYMFTNKFTNHDDLNQMFYADYGTASGRWLLPPLLRLDGNVSMPWLIGVLGILCLAGAVCFAVSLLRIRRPLGCIATAALLVTFPAVAATFGFMFSADAYFFSLLLASFGAYAPLRWGWRGGVVGTAVLVLSMGIYQAYLPAAAALMVGALFLEVLDGKRPFRALLRKGLGLAAVLGLALAVYLLLSRLASGKTGLTGYEGIADMGKLSLSELPRLIARSYRGCGAFFLGNNRGCHFSFLKYAFLLTALGVLALGGLLLLRRRLGAGRTLLALALAALYPLAGSLIYVMVPNGFIHIHMLYGLIYLLVLPIALVEYADAHLQGAETFRRTVGWLILGTMLLTAYSYGVTDNNAYLKADLGMRQCAAYSNRLLERVEALPGYEPGMNVVLVGSTVREDALTPTPELDTADLVGIFDMGDLRTFFTYRYFLRYYLGFLGPVYTGESELAQTFAATEEVQAMPLYPRDGSVRILEDCVVVRLNP